MTLGRVLVIYFVGCSPTWTGLQFSPNLRGCAFGARMAQKLSRVLRHGCPLLVAVLARPFQWPWRWTSSSWLQRLSAHPHPLPALPRFLPSRDFPGTLSLHCFRPQRWNHHFPRVPGPFQGRRVFRHGDPATGCALRVPALATPAHEGPHTPSPTSVF